MNYRHAFHAGNFADLVKHACVLQLLEALLRGPALTVIDTHAGAGAYDLTAPASARSGEAKAGIGRLLSEPAPPAAFASLIAAVQRLNRAASADGRLYPGSPWLIADALRPQDRYIGCELRDDDFALLRQCLAPFAAARAMQADGYDQAILELKPDGPVLVLIDPPFEAADDYDRIVAACAALLRRRPEAVIAIWVPLKDLETFDALLRRLEDLASPLLVAEARLRPLRNPMSMNGCAMLMINATAGVEPALSEVVAWVADTLGEPGGQGRVWRT